MIEAHDTAGRPRFSVVVPAYNASATLDDTLAAMVSQEYEDWECIVVDDGSTDDTAEVARSYVARDTRFRLIQQENMGCPGAYRTGMAAAAASLLVICASDDFLLPCHLKVMDALEKLHPDYEIYSSNGDYLHDDTGVRTTVYTQEEWSRELSLSFEQVIELCFYSVGTVIRREAYDRAGGHRLGVYVDDYDLWLRAMARGARHFYIPRVLSVHRVSGFQQSANLARSFASNVEVYEHLLATEDLTPSARAAVADSIRRNRKLILRCRLETWPVTRWLVPSERRLGLR
jgi:glycosyltransferase involved in cell wall biosynthesis